MTLYSQEGEPLESIMMHELYPGEWERFEQKMELERFLEEEARKDALRKTRVCEPSTENVSRVRQFRAELRKLTRNQIFGATFVKKDGSVRHIAARLGVVPDNPKAFDRARNNERFALLTVFDMRKRDYRTINLNTLLRLQVAGTVLYQQERTR